VFLGAGILPVLSNHVTLAYGGWLVEIAGIESGSSCLQAGGFWDAHNVARLDQELREFQAEYFEPDGVPIVRVRLNAKLVKQPRRVIIALRTFQSVIKSEGKEMRHVIRAFDQALGKVLRHTVEWAVKTP